MLPVLLAVSLGAVMAQAGHPDLGIVPTADETAVEVRGRVAGKPFVAVAARALFDDGRSTLVGAAARPASVRVRPEEARRVTEDFRAVRLELDLKDGTMRTYGAGTVIGRER